MENKLKKSRNTVVVTIRKLHNCILEDKRFKGIIDGWKVVCTFDNKESDIRSVYAFVAYVPESGPEVDNEREEFTILRAF